MQQKRKTEAAGLSDGGGKRLFTAVFLTRSWSVQPRKGGVLQPSGQTDKKIP